MGVPALLCVQKGSSPVLSNLWQGREQEKLLADSSGSRQGLVALATAEVR